MKIILTEYDLKTLEKNNEGWFYRLKTRTGDLVGSGIPTKEEAIKHAEKHLISIVRTILKK
jgi:hypothetical protein